MLEGPSPGMNDKLVHVPPLGGVYKEMGKVGGVGGGTSAECSKSSASARVHAVAWTEEAVRWRVLFGLLDADNRFGTSGK